MAIFCVLLVLMMLFMEVPDGTVPTSPADLAEKVLERTEDFSACNLGCDNHFKGAKDFLSHICKVHCKFVVWVVDAVSHEKGIVAHKYSISIHISVHSKCRGLFLLAIVSVTHFSRSSLLRNAARASQSALSSLDFNVLARVPSFGEARGCILQQFS